MVQLIVEQYGISPNIRAKRSQYTPLMMAARNGHQKVVRVLLQRHRANLNLIDYSGSTALLHAAACNRTHIIRYLVHNAKAEMEIERKLDGFTSLMVSASFGNLQSVEMLLNLGANIESESSDGRTAAHIAMDCYNFDLLQLLIRRGADISYISGPLRCSIHDIARFGSLELKYCVKNGLSEYESYYQQIKKRIDEHSLFCGDIIQIIMDLAYPKPMLLDTNCTKKRKSKKRSRCTFYGLKDIIDLTMDYPPIKRHKNNK